MKVKQEDAKWSCLGEEKLWMAASGHWGMLPKEAQHASPSQWFRWAQLAKPALSFLSILHLHSPLISMEVLN